MRVASIGSPRWIALIASRLITDAVIAGFALLGDVEIGGANFTLSPPGLHPDDPERNKGGMRIITTTVSPMQAPTAIRSRERW